MSSLQMYITLQLVLDNSRSSRGQSSSAIQSFPMFGRDSCHLYNVKRQRVPWNAPPGGRRNSGLADARERGYQATSMSLHLGTTYAYATSGYNNSRRCKVFLGTLQMFKCCRVWFSVVSNISQPLLLPTS